MADSTVSSVTEPAPSGFSWNSHALITAAAMEPMTRLNFKEEAAVRPAEEAAEAILETAERDQDFRTTCKLRDEDIRPARSDLRVILRLNHAIPFPYCRTALEKKVDEEIPHSFKRNAPPEGHSYTCVPMCESLSARDLLATYADEPDWGMDRDLFGRDEYGYGHAPFGADNGPSSQGPFHMLFLKPPFLLRRIFPGLTQSFLPQRFATFYECAVKLLHSGHEYWGLRFAAWACHYVQDAAQPYHATPFPAPFLPLVIQAARSGRFRDAMEANKHYLMNRHYLYEAATHYLLNAMWRSKEGHPLRTALAGSMEDNSADLTQALHEAAAQARRNAPEIDRSVAKLFHAVGMENPQLVSDESLPGRMLTALRDHKFERTLHTLTSLTIPCLTHAGKLTRITLEHIFNGSPASWKPLGA